MLSSSVAVAVALPIGGDDQGELRLLETGIGGKPADAQKLIAVEQQERHLAVVVDLREPRRHLVRELAHRPEEAHADVLRRQAAR